MKSSRWTRGNKKQEDLQGLLAVGVLPEILRRVFLARRTGTLHVASGGERSDFEFCDGYFASVETSLKGANLGDLLVQCGLLSVSDRDACLEIAALSGERLGETMLRHALLNHDQLNQGLGLQLREVLVRTLVWNAGVYTFADTKPRGAPASGFEEPRLDPREVLLDATWTLVADPAIEGLLGDTSQKVRRASDERLQRIDFRLTPADAFLLSRVDGNLTAEQLLQISPLPAAEARACLAGLLTVGVIEYVGAPAPTKTTSNIARSEVVSLAVRITSPDPYEVLDVPMDSTNEEVRGAYLKLVRLCAPAASADPGLRPILHRMSEQLADAFREISNRRNAPHPMRAKEPVAPAMVRSPSVAPKAPSAAPSPSPAVVATRVSVPPTRPAVDPSQAVELAAKASEDGRHYEALAILQEAIPSLHGRARQMARVRKAAVLLAAEGGARLAEDELKSAIAEDPTNAAGHLALGDIYRARRSFALSAKSYRHVLELEPRNVAARDALHRLNEASPESVPGPRR